MMITIPQLRTERIGRVLDEARQIAASDGPIVVGPWMGEVGFELLYWIPFLRWLLAEVQIPKDRITVVSRGGCRHWYADLAEGYVDLFDHMTPGELRVCTRERMAEQAASGPDYGLHRGQMTAKQYGVTKVERELLRRVGLDGSALIHPSLMFGLFRLYWRQRIRDLYARCARPQPMPRPDPIETITGPYAAVKFYSSNACVDRAGTAATIRRLISLIAETIPVVVLDSGDGYDDHGAFPTDDPRVTVFSNLDPLTNLAVQTAVIAHASAFVGTYGGFAYLAPLLGVPTTALYVERTFRDDHYQVASGLFQQWRVPFSVAELSAGLATLQRDGLRGIHAAA